MDNLGIVDISSNLIVAVSSLRSGIPISSIASSTLSISSWRTRESSIRLHVSSGILI